MEYEKKWINEFIWQSPVSDTRIAAYLHKTVKFTKGSRATKKKLFAASLTHSDHFDVSGPSIVVVQQFV